MANSAVLAVHSLIGWAGIAEGPPPAAALLIHAVAQVCCSANQCFYHLHLSLCFMGGGLREKLYST